ncbi:MAG: PAS domain S-box protein, partial [Candidatus Methanoperedens sp.]|nr:PAS domain S-box protein [Candidatus Methanoperedens sp.]
MEIENNSSEQEILIVEDSPTQAEMLKFLLEKQNYLVSVACNGREAFNLLNKHKPIMVISDIVMPEMDGYQLCRSIKDNENLKDIPVILLTALSDPTDVLKGLECGADNFVIKPYDEKYLLSRIQYVLANRMLYESDKTQMGIEIFFGDQKYYITSARQQILNLLLFTYETAVQKNLELHRAQDELSALNEQLEKNVDERTESLRAEIEVRSLGEIALRESEERYRRLVEFSPYGIAIHSEGKLVYMNLAGAKILGAENPDELVGKKLLQIVHPDYHKIAKNRIRMQEEGKVAPPLEEKFLRLDGNSVDVEVTSIPLTYMGKLAMYGVFWDITERKRSQDILAQSEEKYRTLIDNASDAILIADEKGNLLEANKKAEQLLGYKKQELSNMNITQIHPEKEFERTFGAFKEIIKNVSGCLIDAQILRKDGKTVPVDITGSLIDFEGKRVLLGIFRDMTERKRAEQINVENLRLAAADQAKSEFLANMSHELRTPLNSS